MSGAQGDRLRVGVVGAGAMGGAFGYQFAAAGHDVLLIDVWEEHVAEMQRSGVTVVDGAAELTADVTAATSPAGEAPVDVLFVFVKSYETESAVTDAGNLIGRETAVVSLQNGWGNGDVIARAVPEQQIVLGVTYVSAGLTGPGRISRTAVGRTVIGPFSPQGQAVAERVREALAGTGLAVELTDEIRTTIWKKLVLNAAANPTAALTGLASGTLAAHPSTWEFVKGVASEVVAVAQAEGYDIELEPTLAQAEQDLLKSGDTRASMLQDFEAGRRSEIEVITGAVLTAGAAHGTPTPLNSALYALIQGSEHARGLS